MRLRSHIREFPSNLFYFVGQAIGEVNSKNFLTLMVNEADALNHIEPQFALLRTTDRLDQSPSASWCSSAISCTRRKMRAKQASYR